MDTDAIKADIQWLEDLYSNRMLDLEKADADKKKALFAELRDIHSLISQKQVLLHSIEGDKLEAERVGTERRKCEFEHERLDIEKRKCEFERERLDIEKRKCELEHERIEADLAIQKSKSETEEKRIETDGKIDWGQVLTTTVKCLGYGIGMFVIGFVEIRANGYLHERLTKTAEKMM